MPTAQDTMLDNDKAKLESTSSFIPKLPCSPRELDAINKILQLEIDDNNVIAWPDISFSPINEYTTEGLFAMTFPTLFPNGTALPLQPRT